MNIFVTGSAGFIGFHTCYDLLKKGHDVTGIDNLNSYYDKSLKISRLRILCRFKKFKFLNDDINLIENYPDNYDILIHLAAQAGVRLKAAENYLYDHSNFNGTNCVRDFCIKHGIKNVIYASSSSVYSGNTANTHTENDQISKPKSYYAESKIYTEKKFENLGKIEGFKSIGLRFFTVYGPWGSPDMAYFMFTQKILNEEKITLFNKGNNSRDMTYIDDIVEGINLAINFVDKMKSNHEIFNLGNTKPISTNKIVSMIEKRYHKSAKIVYSKRKNEVISTCANLDKAKEILRFNPSVNETIGMKLFFDWFDKFFLR